MNDDSKNNTFTMNSRLDIAPERMWINAPSTLQANHKLHGKNVITAPPIIRTKKGEGDYIRVYFTEGDVISSFVSVLTLSKGWKQTKNK